MPTRFVNKRAGTDSILDLPNAAGLQYDTDDNALKFNKDGTVVELVDNGTQMTPGTGVAGADSYVSGVTKSGGLIITRIVIDIDDLVGSTTDLDIIGDDGVANAHIGQITAAVNGTIVAGSVTCLEVPAGGADDIDLYSSNVGTGTEDVAITDAALGTETALVTSAGAWTSGATKGMTGLPAANDYLYLVNGEGSVPGTFSAGKFLIELFGTA